MKPARLYLAAAISLLLGVTAAFFVGGQAQAAAQANIFGSTVPSLQAEPADSAAVELGVQFKTAVAGRVTGVRFFKGSANTGTHTGSLWSGSTRVATGTFTGETATGWQSLTFASPANITAGTVYTASYLAPKGHYAVNDPFTFPKASGDLTAVKGTYKYGGGYPSGVYQRSNYWVDVLFMPAAVGPPATHTSSTTTAVPNTPTTPPASTSPSTVASPAATTTTAPPVATAFPDATNTGYTNALGFTALKSCALPIKSNTTYQFCDFGTVDVGSTGSAVSNVTFIGTRFKAASVNEKLVGLWGDNITFDYCSFEPNATFIANTQVAFAKSYQYGISADGSYGTHVGKLTVSHSDFWGFGNAIDTAGSTQAKPQVFRDNWIHDAANDNNATYHTDGIGTESGSGTGSYMVLDHNTIESPGNTNGIAFQQGNYSNVTITNNLIGGWGYAVALWAPAPNTVFAGNTFSTRLKPTFGSLYPQSFWTSPGSVWTNNKWSVPTGAASGNPSDNGKFWTPNGPSTVDY